ncbi:MAG TPA: ChbG/HpnK family deacetylase [Gammaproteobacteria bacterium]|jgi:hypothetical protein|nr:ChbG/HpnK family deacetylase [Gammaproteobacteria bacterium]
MIKNIVLCADDYGQDKAISQGILTLIHYGRISAVSCLTNSSNWPEHAQWLFSFKGIVDTGLHFNLTQGTALSSAWKKTYGEAFPPLPTILRKAFLRNLSQKVIEEECQTQLDYFVQSMGKLPDFIDGHQHIHQFPVIRQAIIHVYERALRTNKTYVRLVRDPIHFSDWISNIKKVIIHATGSKAFEKLLLKHEIPHNPSFSGIYPFAQAARYSHVFLQFLNKIQDGGIIMCHPGLASDAANDPIAQVRHHEFQYLLSNQFLEDCRKKSVAIRRLSAII